MDERAAFEKGIDNNPLEATNHLVYADWLDEHGEPDEAEFRRAMGEWIINTRGTRDKEGYYRFPFRKGPVHDDGMDHEIFKAYLPEWANDPNAPESVTERFFGRTRTEPHLAYSPNGYWLHWRGYRNMEEGLRRAFIKNRQQSPEQLSRAATAVRRLRRRS